MHAVMSIEDTRPKDKRHCRSMLLRSREQGEVVRMSLLIPLLVALLWKKQGERPTRLDKVWGQRSERAEATGIPGAEIGALVGAAKTHNTRPAKIIRFRRSYRSTPTTHTTLSYCSTTALRRRRHNHSLPENRIFAACQLPACCNTFSSREVSLRMW